jgi:NDP-hexose 2,3-enoyl reductase
VPGRHELRSDDGGARVPRDHDRALEHGINLFDTANVYGFGDRKGWTEEIVGRWFAQGGGRREKTVIATKLYGSMRDWPNDTFLSARNIRHAYDASLRRLQTDHLDLYQMHHVDRDTPWDEIWQAMETLVTQGKVLYVGSSNFAGWHLAKAQETARRRHLPAWRASSRSTTSSSGRWSSRCCPQRRTTGSA